MRMLIKGICGVLLSMCALMASANSLPEIVMRDLMGLSMRGEATMRFIGFKVYDVRLWTQMKSFTYADPFAVELVYDMSLNGKDIAERSVKEMRSQGYDDEGKRNDFPQARRCDGGEQEDEAAREARRTRSRAAGNRAGG